MMEVEVQGGRARSKSRDLQIWRRGPSSLSRLTLIQAQNYPEEGTIFSRSISKRRIIVSRIDLHSYHTSALFFIFLFVFLVNAAIQDPYVQVRRRGNLVIPQRRAEHQCQF